MFLSVQRKFLSLALGEGVALLVLGGIWTFHAFSTPWVSPFLTEWPFIAVFVLLEWILLQGTLYWLCKWRAVEHNRELQLADQALRFVAFCKISNQFLLQITCSNIC